MLFLNFATFEVCKSHIPFDPQKYIFINTQPQNGGPPLRTISMDLAVTYSNLIEAFFRGIRQFLVELTIFQYIRNRPQDSGIGQRSIINKRVIKLSAMFVYFLISTQFQIFLVIQYIIIQNQWTINWVIQVIIKFLAYMVLFNLLCKVFLSNHMHAQDFASFFMRIFYSFCCISRVKTSIFFSHDIFDHNFQTVSKFSSSSFQIFIENKTTNGNYFLKLL